MSFIKQYWPFLVIILLILIIFFGGYYLGTLRKQNQELLKFKEQQTIENVRILDSVITEKDKTIVILTDSVNKVVKEAVDLNEKSDKKKIIISNDKDKMHKDIDAVDTVGKYGQIQLFNELSREYKP